MVKDVKYIIKRVIIGVLIGLIFSFISGIAKADTVCMQDTWLNADYNTNTAVGNVGYFYGRWVGNCGDNIKIQFPVMFSNSSDVVNFQNNSSIWRLDLGDGQTYYGELKNGFIEFNNVNANKNGATYIKNIHYETTMYNGGYLIISKYFQVFTISDTSTINNSINNVNNSVNNVNNSINNDSVDTNSANNTFDDLNNNMASSSVISDLLLMPINFINKVLDGANNSCTTYHVGDLWGDSFDLPCINGADYVGATLWNVIDCIGAGMLAFMIGKRMVKIFNDLTNLKDGGLDSAYD